MNRDQSFSTSDAYERLVQGVVDYAIYMLDPDGRVMSWNTGAEHIKGYAAGEIIGAHFSRFYTAGDRAAGMPERALRQAREDGRFSAEGWRVRKDGTAFWAMVVIDPIHADGSLIGFAKITRDMTAQREAQRAAFESERRFRLLVEGVTDYAIYLLDPAGEVVNWNAGAERIKGYAAAEIVGSHFSRFYTPEDIADGLPARALGQARRDGRYEAEGWRLRKDGSRFWAGVVVDAIHDQGEFIGFAKITRDLTERRRAQLELDESREQLFQAQKMEAVGQLTGGLAHDFNNMLTGISGSLELIKRRVAQGRIGELDRYIDAAQTASQRAAALTHRLLAFARRQTLVPKFTDANALIAGMRDLIDRTVGPTVTVDVRLADVPSVILCDPHQLENAILNLCINARDAMPDGGCLTIASAMTVLTEPGRPDVAHVAIGVSDTGIGMAPEVAARAFDPFFTTKPLGEGTGLGLSMIYGFAQQSGGRVRLSSAPGTGTTVEILLPRREGEVAVLIPSPVRPPSVARSGETILVVDDEPTIRMLIADVLNELGYKAVEARDGESGLKVLQSNIRVDLLIADVGLPGGMNGRQMADAGRLYRPDLKVLFITGFAEDSILGAANLAPGMHVIAKPFSLEVMAARISDLVGGG